MSLLGWLSGSPNKQAVSTSRSDTNLLIDYHERAELATSVIKLRMSRALVAQGVPRADADAIVAQKIRKEVSNETIALSTPDGAIIQIVETYLYGIKSLRESGEVLTAAQMSTLAIVQIETSRNQFFEGQPNYPNDIYEYVNYRTKLEVPRAVGINPEEMGLDKETVRIITDNVMKYLEKKAA